MRRTLPPMLLMILLASGTPIFAVSGPEQTGIGGLSISAPSAIDDSVQQLTLWLNRAPSTAPVTCSVDRTLAPESVALFEQISAKISALYARVYDEVRAASTIEMKTPMDTVSTATPDVESDVSRARQQAAITANYQATLQEIEQHRKELSRYTDALRTEPAIAGFSSRIQQTIILTQFGRNVYQLGEQLKAAGEGAALILQQRLNTTQDK